MMAATISTTALGLNAPLAAVSTVAAPVMTARPGQAYGPGGGPHYSSTAQAQPPLGIQKEPPYKRQAQSEVVSYRVPSQGEAVYKHQAQNQPAAKAPGQSTTAYKFQGQSEQPYTGTIQGQSEPPSLKVQGQSEGTGTGTYQCLSEQVYDVQGPNEQPFRTQGQSESTYRQILPKSGSKQTLLAESPARPLQVT